MEQEHRCAEKCMREQNFYQDKIDREEPDPFFECDLCDGNFRSKIDIIKHMIQHQCRLCGKIFKKSLKDHVCYVCNCHICEVGYQNIQDLQSHVTEKHADDGNYTCNTCGKKYNLTEKRNLRILRDYTDLPLVSCKICGYVSRNLRTQNKHARQHYKSEFVCLICDRYVITRQSLERHIMQHNHRKQKTKILCWICDSMFDAAIVKEHMQMHPSEKSFICTIYSKTLRQKRTVHNMRAYISEKPFTCPTCDEMSDRECTMRVRTHTSEKPFKDSDSRSIEGPLSGVGEHTLGVPIAKILKEGRKEKPFNCAICNKTFNRRDDLHSHTRVHIDEKPFICATCNRTFKRKCELNSHMLVHTSEKPFTCTICDKPFRHKQSMQMHMRVHNSEKPFSCDICNKTFKRKYELNSHVRVHTGEKPFTCDICNKTFSQCSNLRTHERLHTGEKPFTCAICDKPFGYKHVMQMHMRVHTGEKPFSCDKCDKTFSDHSNLRSHTRLHTGEKPFTCATCNRTFKRKFELNSHLRVHISEKPFTCAICDKPFKRKQELTFHAVSAHQGL